MNKALSNLLDKKLMVAARLKREVAELEASIEQLYNKSPQLCDICSEPFNYYTWLNNTPEYKEKWMCWPCFNKQNANKTSDRVLIKAGQQCGK